MEANDLYSVLLREVPEVLVVLMRSIGNLKKNQKPKNNSGLVCLTLDDYDAVNVDEVLK